MDPRERLRPLLDGVGCTVCGALVPVERIRILAHRDDLAFVELACPGCRSETLGLLLAPDEPDGDHLLDVAPADRTESAGAASQVPGSPITIADVRAMREFLSDWRGDLRDLVDGPREDDERPSAGPVG
jgi:hypothetical protein